jgi:hypothetical protein
VALKEKIKASDSKLIKLMGNEKEIASLRAAKVKLEKLCRSLAKGVSSDEADSNSNNNEENAQPLEEAAGGKSASE